MKNDALKIMNYAFEKANPYNAVKSALENYPYNNVTVISTGKAAVPMAKASYDVLGDRIKKGFVLTKYGHSEPMPSIFSVREASHPVPDENSLSGTAEIIEECKKLDNNDEILFLLSGGASALFELPVIGLEELRNITDCLLKCSAEITQINAVRKRLSSVKGGKFAALCKCHITNIILSDVIGNKLDAVASGPCFADGTDNGEIENIINKYNIPVDENVKKLMLTNSVKTVDNVSVKVVGDVSILCENAKEKAEELGYSARIITDSLTGEARERGREIALKCREIAEKEHKKTALIYGGETTVTVRGNGLGGRNQELALSGAEYTAGYDNIVILAAGSDGTDGPTDAAGGIVDGSTKSVLEKNGISIKDVINRSDSYYALEKCGGLVITGPTGTNVNDLTVALID